MGLFISFNSFDIRHFVEPCKIPCSMQHVVLTPLTYPGSCKTCFSRKPVLIGQYALWSMPTAVLDDLFSSLGGYFWDYFPQMVLKFHLRQDVLLLTPSTLHWNRSVMPKPVSLLTVQEAHKGYSSLTDQIRAKYEQFRLRRVWVTWTPQHLTLKPVNWLNY